MKDETIEMIGLLSAVLTTFAFVPGVIAVWRSKPDPAAAVSFWMYLLFTVGLLGWIIYGFLIWSIPVISANIVTILLVISILYYKIKYG